MVAPGDSDHTDSPNSWHQGYQANTERGDEVRVIYLSSTSYRMNREPVDGSARMLCIQLSRLQQARHYHSEKSDCSRDICAAASISRAL